ncbi:peroxidase [Bradyrhizobium sp. U87765 SZCCT0131]|uniref:Dyp-type peroxidase n=1 Tax=unclassified Bradyrhizobium TaxID=2631580 RepID=UPI001BA99BE5|nr:MULTISPECIES: peroxidase [unclassified Bradyrhizobium]MBR1219350.1 peroxidase [Bradyrhizobium sp. U87765 SZCCT0131]MBR1262001.1 peroxidase [Bradyrhizobium sp. U87765 SZCCT0134]MBR1306146.1 peroxidase [Bradyrhizobium sp. U87765 SZCCT0110]MBR1317783.1 peroxidase [Bradyrhizobium sp. U87765 SZCCT0109]MBR1351485.1 peroxidase [Bradyrhizobium sp. U87765 SZCCT0048]
MDKVEWDDVQGLVLSGYPRLPYSAYVLFRFHPERPDAARAWLGALAGRLMRASDGGGDDGETDAPTLGTLKRAKGADLHAINLALTARGLGQLPAGAAALKDFSVEFVEGMAPPTDPVSGPARRTNLLGDLGDSSPATWEWGGWNGNGDIDGMLMLFAPDGLALQSLIGDELATMAQAADPVRIASPGGDDPRLMTGRVYDDRKEHFGYTDGISQPIIEGSPRARRGGATEDDKRIHHVKPGEFVFGYHNERRVRTNGAGAAELKRNGTYLVFRQLEQDVAGFRDFVARAAAELQGPEDATDKEEWIAARLVGRTRAGKPLACPAAHAHDPSDPVARHSSGNDFLFYFGDRFGLQCPIGSHIRRANPRDTKGPDPDTALRLSKMHRIIRRSRMYGERYDADARNGEGRRGVLFVCLNADIAGQFEMIQHSWLNNRHFGDLYVGTDPIGHSQADGGAIVIQRRPTNLVLQRPKPFVRVRGGAYFFLPGIAAVRALAG